MKQNFFSKLSNRTKVILAAAVSLGIGAVVSAIVDGREIKEIENDFDTDIAGDISDAVDSVATAAEGVLEF